MKQLKTDEYKVIFVASYWNKKAQKRIYASSYGLKAFPIRVRVKKPKK